MGRTGSVAHSLRGLELDLARDQDRIARSASDFLRRNPFSHRDYCSSRSIVRASALVAAARVGLRCTRIHWRVDVCGKLRATVLG